MIAGLTSAAHAETVMDAVAMSVRRTFFIFCSPVFVRQFCALTKTPHCGSQLVTGLIPPEAGWRASLHARRKNSPKIFQLVKKTGRRRRGIEIILQAAPAT